MVLSNHDFGLFYLSWLLFWLVGGTSTLVDRWLPPSPTYDATMSLGYILVFIGTAFAGLISGFVADRFGRKKPIIFGFVTLGISYAIFGIANEEITYLTSQLFFGASYGIVFGTFFMTVVGDMASTDLKEKYYAIGSLGFILYMIFLLFSRVFKLTASASAVTSILSLVLFIAVVPLLFAPETLPEEKVRKRRFKEHLEKVQKIIEEEKTP